MTPRAAVAQLALLELLEQAVAWVIAALVAQSALAVAPVAQLSSLLRSFCAAPLVRLTNRLAEQALV